MVFTDQDSRLDMTITVANFTYDHNCIHHPTLAFPYCNSITAKYLLTGPAIAERVQKNEKTNWPLAVTALFNSPSAATKAKVSKHLYKFQIKKIDCKLTHRSFDTLKMSLYTKAQATACAYTERYRAAVLKPSIAVYCV